MTNKTLIFFFYKVTTLLLNLPTTVLFTCMSFKTDLILCNHHCFVSMFNIYLLNGEVSALCTQGCIRILSNGSLSLDTFMVISGVIPSSSALQETVPYKSQTSFTFSLPYCQ